MFSPREELGYWSVCPCCGYESDVTDEPQNDEECPNCDEGCLEAKQDYFEVA